MKVSNDFNNGVFMKKVIAYLICLCLGSVAVAQSEVSVSREQKVQKKIAEIEKLSKDLEKLIGELENSIDAVDIGVITVGITAAVGALFMGVSAKKLGSMSKKSELDALKYLARATQVDQGFAVAILGENVYLVVKQNQIEKLCAAIEVKRRDLQLAKSALEATVN
jgi:hypothetical protein